MNTRTDTMELAIDQPASGLLGLAERGLLPDALLRAGIRRLCTQRLREEHADDPAAASHRNAHLINELRRSPVAIHTDAANRQHYELPPEFFRQCLGPRLKYSGCYYPTGSESLGEAEAAMLSLYGERAELADGQDILELGCGWGSLTLWMAEQFPQSRITAVSNSSTQRKFIESRCRERGFTNVRVVTNDVNWLEMPDASFDRCVSVEMFEHMRNHGKLMENISGWLKPGGRFFLHSFCHRDFPYFYEDEGESDWMARHFFTGGVMPAWDLPLQFQQQLKLVDRWAINGEHYARTCRAWLSNCDRNREQILAIFSHSPDPSPPEVQLNRWRLFFMACECLFACLHGNEWFVGHYLFEKQEPAR